MPTRCAIAPHFDALLHAQDWVVHRDQAMAAGMTRAAIDHRIASRQWGVLLPSVYLAHRGESSRRQMLISAQLYAGPLSAIDAADACRWHGIKCVAIDDSRVYVVAPWEAPCRTVGFVVVRRTMSPIVSVEGSHLRFVDAATAAIAATRLMSSDRPVLAALSDALQRRATTYDELVRAHIQGPRRNAKPADKALALLADGARSAAEADFLKLASASLILPRPECNAVLRLPTGRLISPDALFIDAGLVHEVNGRIAHQRDDLYDDTHERADAMTEAGLTVLGNTPLRLTRRGREVVRQVENIYTKLAGRGLPPGVEVVRLAD